MQVEAAWAVAAQVVISGAAGCFASWINERFEQVDFEILLPCERDQPFH